MLMNEIGSISCRLANWKHQLSFAANSCFQSHTHLVKEPPSGDEWLHELKFDGYRMLCRIDRGRVSMWSRNGKDWTEKFQNVVEAVKSLKATSAMLDGEIVIVDAQGRSSFQKLQRAIGKATITGFAYEVFISFISTASASLRLLRHRKELLKNLVGSNSRGVIRYSEHISGSGDEFFKHACEYGIEGIVSKLANSHYESKTHPESPPGKQTPTPAECK